MTASVFPARAGMNQVRVNPDWTVGGVPRASGDEPSYNKDMTELYMCSPRERG